MPFSHSLGTWHDRQHLLFLGAPLTLIPALLFLPAVLYLVVTPRIPHAAATALVVFPALLVAELFGVIRLLRCAMGHSFDLITAMAVGTLIVLLVIAAYTGIFLAVLAARI